MCGLKVDLTNKKFTELRYSLYKSNDEYKKYMVLYYHLIN